MDKLFLGDTKVSYDSFRTAGAFQELIKNPLYSDKFTGKTIGNSTHLRSKHFGIELQFHLNLIHSIFYYIDSEGMKCTSSLPYSILPSMTMEDILHKMGEPKDKRGGKVTEVQFSYPLLGVDLVFKSKNWESHKSGISYIVCYPKTEGKPGCGLCSRDACKQCNCGLVWYCSAQCQEKLSDHHKQYCLT